MTIHPSFRADDRTVSALRRLAGALGVKVTIFETEGVFTLSFRPDYIVEDVGFEGAVEEIRASGPEMTTTQTTQTTDSEAPAIHVECSAPTAGTTGAGGWDLDVTVTIDDRELEGELTLLPSEHDGSPSAWGAPDNWVSSGLLAELRARAPGADALRDILSAIEAVAIVEIQSSGVEPAEGS